jgi:hypothetical protein
MFVVDQDGRPNVNSLQTLNTAAAPFVESIRDALKRTRFVPAQKDSASVSQVVQLTYDFGLRGDPERGDIVVRPPVSVTESAPKAVGPHTLYVIGSDELSAPGIEQMNLVDALSRLRPKLFGPISARTNTTPAEQPVFVNNVRVEGLAALRGITAGNVEEVRYWKREEAAMKFGMDYMYAITVKLRPERS